LRVLVVLAWLAAASIALAGRDGLPTWTLRSSRAGDLDAPRPSPAGTAVTQQTSVVVFDADRDGLLDFAVAERTAAPALAWYRQHAGGWTRGVVDGGVVPIEAGACAGDVDGDGDADLIAGGDASSASIWWWENPHPAIDAASSWRRHTVKAGGQPKHHDLAFGDIDADGKPELVFWNQGARTLFLAEIPPRPRAAASWPLVPIFTYSGDGQPEQRSQRGEPAWKRTNEHEGLALADIDQNGALDIVAGGSWFSRDGPRWMANPIDPTYTFTRLAVGQLVEGGRPEVILVVGDGTGPLVYYEWTRGTWLARQLLDAVRDGHSLAVADVDGDGHLDIFLAEMRIGGGNPESVMYLLYGDGRGSFRPTIVATGFDNHESTVADLDGDGRLDILGKPYNHETPAINLWLQRPPR
jgi:hypothetical protein